MTFWEHVNKLDLILNHGKFYSLSVDVVSLLTVVASASRLPAYCFCNPAIQFELTAILEHLASNICMGKVECLRTRTLQRTAPIVLGQSFSSWALLRRRESRPKQENGISSQPLKATFHISPSEFNIKSHCDNEV